MKLLIISPTKALIQIASPEEMDSLNKQLSYKDLTATHELKRLSKNFYFKNSNPLKWKLQCDALKEQINQCLVFDDNGIKYIRPGSISYLENIYLEIDNQIVYPTPKKIPWAKQLPFELYPYQKQSVEKLIEAKHGNVSLTTGCHAKGTLILMFDGSLKKVEDVIVGDQLMGPDSKPRNVLELHTDNEMMYKITPVKGESFVVNEGHILSLQRTNLGNTYLKKDGTRSSQKDGPNPIVNLSVHKYLKLNKHQKHIHKLYRVGCEFKTHKILKIPPYILGLWLGDGSSANSSLTTMDEEIRLEWTNYLISLGLCISIQEKVGNKAKTYGGVIEDYKPAGRTREGVTRPRRQNEFNALLQDYSLIHNKHIPFDYLTSSRQDRLELLAGIIDTDGYYHHGHFEIIQKNKKLADEILFLARSLGFGATKRNKISRDQNGTEGTYVRIFITGESHLIPTRLKRKKGELRKQIKSVLRTGFSVEPVGKGDYYGFTVDSDNLYLMGDFTVTHNSGKSACLLSICRETGFRTAVIAPSKAIFNELVEKFEHHLGKGNIGKYGDGKKKIGKKITICIGDSLCNLNRDSEEWKFFSGLDMICVDESHSWGSDTLEDCSHGVFSEVPYRFFFSATQTRGDGGIKLLQSIIGPTVHSLTTKEAVDGGFILPHDFRIVKLESSNPNLAGTDPLEIKREHFLRNKNIANFSAKLANALGERGEQTLILVEELSQVATLAKLLKVPFGYAHSESKKERLAQLGLEKVDVAEQIERFNKNEFKVLIVTSCGHVGVNIFPATNTINCVGGASEIKTRQAAIGRSIRLPEANPYAHLCGPKKKCTIWDFDVVGNYVLERHLEARIACYQDSGEGLIKYVKL